MKSLLKLIVAGAVVFGAYRAGMAEYRYSQLKDSTRSILVLGEKTALEDLKQQILTRAADLALTVPPAGGGLPGLHVSARLLVQRRDRAVSLSSARASSPSRRLSSAS